MSCLSKEPPDLEFSPWAREAELLLLSSFQLHILLCVCVRVSACACACVRARLLKLEKGVRSVGVAVVTGGCELLEVGAGNQTLVL